MTAHIGLVNFQFLLPYDSFAGCCYKLSLWKVNSMGWNDWIHLFYQFISDMTVVEWLVITVPYVSWNIWNIFDTIHVINSSNHDNSMELEWPYGLRLSHRWYDRTIYLGRVMNEWFNTVLNDWYSMTTNPSMILLTGGVWLLPLALIQWSGYPWETYLIELLTMVGCGMTDGQVSISKNDGIHYEDDRLQVGCDYSKGW